MYYMEREREWQFNIMVVTNHSVRMCEDSGMVRASTLQEEQELFWGSKRDQDKVL